MSLNEKQKMKEIKLKSQPKWMVRMFILVWAILWGVFAFISHPIWWTNAQSMDCPEWKFLATGDVCITNDKDIVIQATATEANQTLKINKYFANAYTVDRWDGMTEDLTANTTHTYDTAWIYEVVLSLSWANRWTFQNGTKPLVPTAWTTVTWVQIIYMPSLADWFGNSATIPGNYFFKYFNYWWSLTNLPTNSFDTSNITTVGNSFFHCFNYFWKLTTLPVNSFDTSNISGTVGNNFFSCFNLYWKLTSLPEWSFNVSNIITVGNDFFSSFNEKWAITSLPEWSFNIINIMAVGNNFFYSFNDDWELTGLPEWSFDTSNISGTVGNNFFCRFNQGWQLTSLPEWSFDMSNITTVGNNFFDSFNYIWELTSLSGCLFDMSNIMTVGNNFFSAFNSNWQLTSLPEWSFDTSNITTVWDGFFYCFNCRWAITSLPEWSFDTNKITTVGNDFFMSFNSNWQLTSLPEWSFNTNNITTAGDSFFSAFNSNWQLTTLPSSFTMSSVWALVTGDYDEYFLPGAFDGGYSSAFHSSYMLNKKVSDLVSWVAAPLYDRNTFSDNQPWRCWVDPNWLNTTSNACSITYDANGWSAISDPTVKYTADTTWVVVWQNITIPTKSWYILSWWYTETEWWERVETIIFPDMDGETIYAQWKEISQYTVTYNANGWNTTPSAVTVESNTSINLPNAPRDGYEFLWWYTEEEEWIRVWWYNDTYTVSQDVILYAHWIEVLPEGIFFQTWDITYTDTNWKVFTWIGTITFTVWDDTITILDRNLWATTNDTWNDDSLWYYFQWWNNYWFTNDSWINNIDLMAVSWKLDTLGNGWNNPYISNIIITDRTNIWNAETYNINSNLWWWSWDSINNNWWEDTLLDWYKRQWPCPEWFHVPSQWERDKLVKLRFNKNKGYQYVDRFWVQNNLHYFYWSNYLWTLFLNNFLLRERSAHFLWSDQYNNPRFQWWSSSSDINGFRFWDARSGSVTMIRAENRPDLKSVRCFKDMTWYLVMQYETNWWTPIQAQTTVSWEIWYLPWYTTQKTWVDFLWWYTNSECTEKVELSWFTFNKIITWNTIFYAWWWYDYILLDRDESVIESWKVLEWKNINPSVLPNRNWYTFVGRDKDLTNISGNLVARAIYQKKEISNWWWTKLSKDYCPWWDYSDSYYDWDCGTDPKIKEENDEEENVKVHNSAEEFEYDSLKSNPYYSDEMNQAYQFAYHYWITTKNNIKDAAMNWELTRIAMAKMLSQYAVNVLWIKPDTTRNNEFADVSDKLDTEYDDWVTLAYQLWIMWINMPNNEFRPYWYVTRAEFATALSRLLYNTSDWEFEKTSKYYVPHIDKLAYEWILTNTDPYMKELRGYVMLMLMRSAK